MDCEDIGKWLETFDLNINETNCPIVIAMTTKKMTIKKQKFPKPTNPDS